MTEQTVINVSGVTKSFGHKTVVNGLDMQVRKGEIFGFLGPNGSGKPPLYECFADFSAQIQELERVWAMISQLKRIKSSPMLATWLRNSAFTET